MSYVARSYIRLEWDAQIKEVKTKIGKILARKDLKFEPNWEENWAALVKQANKRNSELSRFKLFEGTWERSFPEVMRKYYEGLAFNLQKLKFGEDEMLREGFNEAVESGRVVFRIVEELEDLEDGYGAAIEDGVLYMQVSRYGVWHPDEVFRVLTMLLSQVQPDKWDGMPGDASKNILDLL